MQSCEKKNSIGIPAKNRSFFVHLDRETIKQSFFQGRVICVANFLIVEVFFYCVPVYIVE